MASIPRILAVDRSSEIASILRGAMTLMDRAFILVEVPTAEDALAELRNSQVDLLVTSYALPDLNGQELASRAIRESAGTPVIILASSDDPEVDPNILLNQPYHYLVRPVGEQFLRALRVGLDGEAAVASQETSSIGSTALELGPVPNLEQSVLRDQLFAIMRDTASMGGFVANRMGRVVFAEGATGYFDIDFCAAKLAPYFAQTIYFREMIGGNAWSLQYFDGDEYDLFAISLGLHYFAVLIFDGSKRPQFGPVTNYGRKGADSIIEVLGAEAWSYRRSLPQKTATQAMPMISAEEPAAPEPEVPVELARAHISTDSPKTIIPPTTPDLNFEPVENLDMDVLFNQSIDEGSFDNLFADEDLSGASLFGKDDSVSFDEAIDMGILDE
jgi:CheY-like chemotaxis protein